MKNHFIATSAAKPNVGDRIAYKFAAEEWYLGTVMNVDDKVHIHFDDDEEWSVKVSMKLKKVDHPSTLRTHLTDAEVAGIAIKAAPTAKTPSPAVATPSPVNKSKPAAAKPEATPKPVKEQYGNEDAYYDRNGVPRRIIVDPNTADEPLAPARRMKPVGGSLRKLPEGVGQEVVARLNEALTQEEMELFSCILAYLPRTGATLKPQEVVNGVYTVMYRRKGNAKFLRFSCDLKNPKKTTSELLANLRSEDLEWREATLRGWMRHKTTFNILHNRSRFIERASFYRLSLRNTVYKEKG